MCCATLFLSTRTRHTRWPREWSSDVCSSDLLNDTWRAATTTTEFRETGLTRGAARPLLPQGRAEHFLHEPSSAAARGIARPLRVAPAVGPDRVRHTPEGHQALVVPLLVAVVDRGAGKQAVAVVLVRALGGDPHVRRPGGAAVGGAREVDVGHEALAGPVVLRVVVRGRHVAARRIDGEPLIEAIRPCHLVAHRGRR